MIMEKIVINRPKREDRQEIHALFERTIPHTFAKDGAEDLVEDIQGEVASKKRKLEEDFETEGVGYFFLVARHGGKIVGTITYGPTDAYMIELSGGKFETIGEIGSLFIMPEFQGRGIGTLLLNAMYMALIGKGVEEFVLDSGYPTAQKVWAHVFGEPDIIARDYWAVGADHHVWHRMIVDVMPTFMVKG